MMHVKILRALKPNCHLWAANVLKHREARERFLFICEVGIVILSYYSFILKKKTQLLQTFQQTSNSRDNNGNALAI